MFIPDKLRWRRQQAKTCDSLALLAPDLQTETGKRLAAVYGAQLAATSGRIPSKDGFESWRLKGDLAHVVLYDLIDRQDLVFRLVGEELKTRFGYNPDGRSYLEFVPPERRESALEAFQLCATTPCAMHVLLRQRFSKGGYANCEVLGVPLADREGDVEARYLLFVNRVIEHFDALPRDLNCLQVSQILSRRFVDVGFGCPADFRDLVPR